MRATDVTMIRRDTDYALRMLMHLAEQARGGVSASELSDQLGVPYGFAQKILRKLAAAGMLKAQPGRNGGFRLLRNPRKVSLMDVVAAVQGPPLLNRCMGDPNACARQPSCPVSDCLRVFQDKLNRFLRSTKISSIIDRSHGGSGEGVKLRTTVKNGGTRTSRPDTRKIQG